jgi:GDPmannose 4,6-dehydratase
MWRMLQLPTAEDFVVATGKPYRLEQFVEAAFRELGLNWRDYVEVDSAFQRPSDIACSWGDPTKSRQKLGWSTALAMPDVVKRMVAAELENLKTIA